MDNTRPDEAGAVAVSPIDTTAPRRRGRAWHNALLATKVTALIAAAAAAGGAIGITAAFHHPGNGVWIMSLGLTGLILVLTRIGRTWVWRPYVQLLSAADRIAKSERNDGLDTLPVTRRDEVGQLARHLHDLASSSMRHRREAHLARRSIDARVAEATRKATAQLRRVAMRDPLTNLGNRRFLDETFEPLVRTVRSAGADLACLLIDVDNFKQLNDTRGHTAGDELLVLLASLLRGSIRYSDYAVRFGGDEFVLLMPGCDPDRAKLLARRFSKLFQQHTDTTTPSDLGVTLSIGIASLLYDRAETGSELLEIADKRLYEAKRAGKSQAVGATSGRSRKSVDAGRTPAGKQSTIAGHGRPTACADTVN